MLQRSFLKRIMINEKQVLLLHERKEVSAWNCLITLMRLFWCQRLKMCRNDCFRNYCNNQHCCGSGWHQFMTRPWLCSMFHVKVYEEANPSLHFASYFSHRIAARLLAKVSLIIIDRVPDYLVLLQLLQGWLDFTSLSRSAVEISRINHPLFLPHPPP